MRYGGGKAPTGNTVQVNFTLTQTLPRPVYLYYGLRSYYQNHRRYLKYFSTDQMNGKEIDLNAVSTVIILGKE